VNPTDTKKIDSLIQLALLCAGQEEDWSRRELGAIHLIKYVYLADYHYALTHGGQTYTGLQWRFYKFGPWEETCFLRIEPALQAIGAEKRIFSHPKYEDDFVKWLCSDSQRYEELQEQLSLEIVGQMARYVRKFGADTEGLIDFVYKTPPMLKAAPNDMLTFVGTLELCSSEQTDDAQKLTRRQEKKLNEKLEQLRLEMRKQLEQKKAVKGKRFQPSAPRYDDVFFKGVAQLDRIAGEPITPQECLMEVAEDAWRSKARFDTDLSCHLPLFSCANKAGSLPSGRVMLSQALKRYY